MTNPLVMCAALAGLFAAGSPAAADEPASALAELPVQQPESATAAASPDGGAANDGDEPNDAPPPARLARDRWVNDVRYSAATDRRRRLNLFIPSGEPRPLLVYIHGGAWARGDRQQGTFMLSPAQASGQFALASIGYRLSKQAQWPAQREDCLTALRWLHRHAETIGFEGETILLMGASAGGHLALHCALETADETDDDPLVDGVLNFFGPTRMRGLVEDESGRLIPGADRSPIGQLFGGDLAKKEEAMNDASPIEHITAAAPPILTFQGTADPLVPHTLAVAFHEALTTAGVANTLVTVEDGGHGDFLTQPEVLVRSTQFLTALREGREPAVSDAPIVMPAARR